MRNRAVESVRAALSRGFSREEIENAPPLKALRRDGRYREISGGKQ